jgi:hypothetical protein
MMLAVAAPASGDWQDLAVIAACLGAVAFAWWLRRRARARAGDCGTGGCGKCGGTSPPPPPRA